MKVLIIFSSVFFFLTACVQDTGQDTSQRHVHTLKGETMGTYYQVSYVGEENKKLPVSLDSLLGVLDLELSTYNPVSVISRFNKGEDFQSIAASQASGHFIRNFDLAQAIYTSTQGYFDPSVMPLVNYWGFGYDPSTVIKTVDSSSVDSLLQWVGFDKIKVESGDGYWTVIKPSPVTQIDFSAIAKGYGVDQLAQLLDNKGLRSYLVDIGGEVRAKGKKKENTSWLIGIAIPLEAAAPSDYMAAVAIDNKAIATSGNYRNFHEIDGVKYSHTINPFTGFPERSRLLSASVMAIDCATADAFATACMVAGLDKGFAMIERIAELEGFFVYSSNNGELLTRTTSGFPIHSD